MPEGRTTTEATGVCSSKCPTGLSSRSSDKAANPVGSSSGCRHRKYTARNTMRPATKQPSAAKIIEFTIGATYRDLN